MHIRLFLAAACLLSACAGQPPDGGVSAPPTRIELAPEGLNIPRSGGLEIGFGRAMAGAVRAVARVTRADYGAPETNPECGAGRVTSVRFANGLTLNFTDDGFRGWVATTARSGTTRGGLTVGGPRSSLGDTPVVATALGNEFRTDGVHGLIDETDHIGALWAGTTCFFRQPRR